MSRLGRWGQRRDREPSLPVSPLAEVDLPGLGPTLIVQSVDCVGAMCPRPQLLVMKVLQKVQSGQVIEVRCDNAAAVESFPALALSLACTHVATLRGADGWRVYLRKGH